MDMKWVTAAATYRRSLSEALTGYVGRRVSAGPPAAVRSRQVCMSYFEIVSNELTAEVLSPVGADGHMLYSPRRKYPTLLLRSKNPYHAALQDRCINAHPPDD